MRLLFFLICLPFVLLAQSTDRADGALSSTKGWQELTISGGLSQGMIHDLKQDRRGFIWIATKDGLNRYDGHNVRVFTHDPYDPFSLADNVCKALLIDRKQRLWIGTEKQGLVLFDAQTERFYRIMLPSGAGASTSNPEITGLVEAPDGAIWVCAVKHQAYRITLPDTFDPKQVNSPDLSGQAQVQHVSVMGNRPKTRTMALSFAPNGRAWFSTYYGLFAVDHRQPTHVTQLAENVAPASDLKAMLVDAPRGYWFEVNNGHLQVWHRGVGQLIPLAGSAKAFVQLAWLDAKTIAVATVDHLWLFSPEALFRQDSLNAHNAYTRLPPNLFYISSILRDKTGLIWLGTGGYGLRWFNPQVKRFTSSLPTVSLTNLLQDRRGRTYARYLDHYGELDPTTGKLRRFLPGNIHELSLRNLIQDRQGLFWLTLVNIQTQQHLLLKFSEDWQLLQTYNLPPGAELGFSINRTLEDRAGNLWIGTTNGKLTRFEPRTGTFRVLTYAHLLPKQGSDIETYALYQDRAGMLWIGLQQGLIQVKSPTGTPSFAIHRNDVNDRQSLSDNYVSTLADDPSEPDRHLWIGTKGGGLNRLDKQTLTNGPARFDHVGERDGLPNKVVYGLLPDGLGNLWLSTNRGIAQFNPKTRSFRTYTKTDGLQDDEFNTNSFVSGTAGKLLFGGVNGLTTFRPVDFRQLATTRPVAHIINLRINNKPVAVGDAEAILSAPIEQTQRLDLAHDQNLLTLEFGVMDYTNTAQNRFRYQLEGIDQDWVEAGTNRFANYAQLPNGTYTLRMMGSADGELWSEPTTLTVRVNPPFYRSWGAYLLYALVLGGLSWQGYRFQKQRWQLQQEVSLQQEESKRMAELDALKTRFFTNISHEFRTPLTLILGPLEQLVPEYAHDTRFPVLQRNAQRLLDLINQLLDLSKLEAGQLLPDPQPGDLAQFCRTLASSFQSLAESRGIPFTFEQQETSLWASFDRDKLEKIVTNLLSNAFKFTPAGRAVRMQVQYAPSVGGGPLPVRLVVQDEGIGIPPDQLTPIFDRFYQQPAHAPDKEFTRAYEGTGIGLALVQELVQMLDGTIQVESKEGKGTTFTVMLSVRPSVAAPAPTVAQRVTSTGTGGLLLIIDDNADIRAYIRSIFADDYQILEAENGQQGLELATETLPDLVICDLMMPLLDGFGFCRALKTGEVTSHIPVVMLTARATLPDRIEGFELGADDYLTKPFHADELRVRVRNLLAQRERLRQYFRQANTVVVADDGLALAQPETVVLPPAEHLFIGRLTDIVQHHLDDPQFSVEQLAGEANLSRTQLHRKLKAVMDTNATQFIRDIRLARAAELLTEGEQNVTQVAYAVGFDNPSYFSKQFQERYGVLPSRYAPK